MTPDLGATQFPRIASPPSSLVYGAPPPPTGTPVMAQQHKGRFNPLIWVGIGLAVLLGGIAVAIALTSSTPSTAFPSIRGTAGESPATSQPATPAPPATSAPAIAPPPTQPLSQQQAAALSDLLAQSVSDRAAVVGAVADVNACGDLYSDETNLNEAYSSRESLLSQLQNLDLGVSPGGSQLDTYLASAWQASAAADQSYAAWASDEANTACTVDDDSDLNYQNAQSSDSESTANKTSFAAAWNPIASAYGLPTVTASSI